MKCMHCHAPDTKVLESRESKDELTVRRRRVCQNPKCGFRFTTFERAEEQPIWVIKRDASREPFDRAKLQRSVQAACRKRQVSPKDIEALVEWVERNASSEDDREIRSSKVGELVLDALRHLDFVAYVRFASVYRAFSGPEDFALELRKHAENPPSPKLPDDFLKRMQRPPG